MNTHICKAKVVYGCSWGKKPGEWVYGYYVALPDEYGHDEDICHAIFEPDCEHVYMGEYKDDGWYKVDPDTVCRCTGERDKDGNLIFEHDIVSAPAGLICEVIWYNGCKYVGWALKSRFRWFNENTSIFQKELDCTLLEFRNGNNLVVLYNKFDNT